MQISLRSIDPSHIHSVRLLEAAGMVFLVVSLNCWCSFKLLQIKALETFLDIRCDFWLHALRLNVRTELKLCEQFHILLGVCHQWSLCVCVCVNVCSCILGLVCVHTLCICVCLKWKGFASHACTGFCMMDESWFVPSWSSVCCVFAQIIRISLWVSFCLQNTQK